MLPTCGLALTEYKTCFIGRFNRLCYIKKKKKCLRSHAKIVLISLTMYNMFSITILRIYDLLQMALHPNFTVLQVIYI